MTICTPALFGCRRPAWPVSSRALAQWTSDIGSPPVIGLITTGIVAGTTGGGVTWAWAGLHAMLAVLLPTGYVGWLVCRGEVTDMHLPHRRERFRPLLFSLVTGALSIGALHWGHAPTTLKLLASLQLAQLGLLLLLTLRWKVSAHCAAASGLAALAVSLWGVAGFALCLGVPLIAWSRLRLVRHTRWQTVSGALVGALLWGAVLIVHSSQDVLERHGSAGPFLRPAGSRAWFGRVPRSMTRTSRPAMGRTMDPGPAPPAVVAAR